MLGGMWGYQNFRNREVADKVINLIKNRDIARNYNPGGNSRPGGDQDFLGAHIWSIASPISLTHASFHCHSFGGAKILPFPVQRQKTECFATCSICCDTKYNKSWPQDWICPEDCRPKDHLDWKYC
jgi:hypothetical protein